MSHCSKGNIFIIHIINWVLYFILFFKQAFDRYGHKEIVKNLFHLARSTIFPYEVFYKIASIIWTKNGVGIVHNWSINGNSIV